MTWIWAGLLSALFLGVYDVFKKHAVSGNAVLPVLFFSNCCAACIWLPAIVISVANPELVTGSWLEVQPLSWAEHLLMLAKSALVALSWVFSYFALKHLPLSVAGPIRATSPLWTLVGALFLFQESPSALQFVGIGITLIFFFALSLIGKREGLHFHRNRWVGFMVLATLVGACCGLYDKYLLAGTRYTPSTVQAWFSIYLVVVLAPLYFAWKKRVWPRGDFQWRWSIPLIGISLLVADFAYFGALKEEAAMISIIACIRRGNTLVSFVAGFLIFGEKHWKLKAPCLLGVLLGIWIIVLNS